MSGSVASADNGNVLAKPFEDIQGELQKKCDYIFKRIDRLKGLNEAASHGVLLTEQKEDARKKLPEVESQLDYLKRLTKLVEESRVKHKRANKEADRVSRATTKKNKSFYMDGISMGHLISVVSRPDFKKAYTEFMKNGCREEDKMSIEQFRMIQEVHFLLSPTSEVGESYNEFIDRIQVSNTAVTAILEGSTDFVVEGATGADILSLVTRFRDSQFWSRENEAKKQKSGRKASVFEFATSSLKDKVYSVTNSFFAAREEHEIVFNTVAEPVVEKKEEAAPVVVEKVESEPLVEKPEVEAEEAGQKSDSDGSVSSSVSLKSSSPSGESVGPIGDENVAEALGDATVQVSESSLEVQRKASLVTSSSVENETPRNSSTPAEVEKNTENPNKLASERTKRPYKQRPRNFNGNKKFEVQNKDGERVFKNHGNYQNGNYKARFDENGVALPRKQFENRTNGAQRFNKGDATENLDRSQNGYDKPRAARTYPQKPRVRGPPPGVCGFTFTFQ